MNRSALLLSLSSAFAAAILALPHHAMATLGEPADSIATDRHALSAVHRGTMVYNSYTVQEVASSATTIREYVTLSGVIFAVAWKGMSHPDLTPLLGSFAPEYSNAARRTARIPGHRRLYIRTDRVVVEKWGQMRALQGRAYLPAMIPPGVSLEEIK